MGPIGSMNSGSVNIRRIENGYEVMQSQESKTLTPDGNNYLYDYKNATYAFTSIEEAVAKAKELLA